jgi:hypothetical protein
VDEEEEKTEDVKVKKAAPAKRGGRK